MFMNIAVATSHDGLLSNRTPLHNCGEEFDYYDKVASLGSQAFPVVRNSIPRTINAHTIINVFVQ